MFLLTMFNGIKKWVVLVIGAIVIFFTTYLAGILKGRKQIENKDKQEKANEQELENKQAQDTYKEAEQAAHSVPELPIPNTEKRDDLDTTK